MSSNTLRGVRVAFLATDGVERVELESPRDAVRDAGAEVKLLTIEDLSVDKLDNDKDPAGTEQADGLVADFSADDFDALVLPGGVANPDKLRLDSGAVAFAKAFVDQGKPVAAICHGPWLLVEADVVRDRTLTSFPSIQTDLRNAGATWQDEEVVVDDGLITSRSPDDLDAFNAKIVDEFAAAAR
ncbi:MAG: type 1 glutamine amidotransferase domain-containing protein [Solirubrobacteraceae bacterium]|nr:type 1 glutamine amidotransferase domain-containing protein [Solirubrobacteraceae bacterium]